MYVTKAEFYLLVGVVFIFQANNTIELKAEYTLEVLGFFAFGIFCFFSALRLYLKQRKKNK